MDAQPRVPPPTLIGAALVGRRVRLHGLAARPALNGCEGSFTLNGCEGSCLSYDADKGRYAVMLTQDAQAASGACIKALRPWLSADNLTAVADPDDTLLGTVVRLVGLQATPELNGRIGTAVAFDAAEGRYRVLLLGASATTVSRWGTVAAVRARNLEPVVQLDAL